VSFHPAIRGRGSPFSRPPSRAVRATSVTVTRAGFMEATVVHFGATTAAE
jgi:hypothetical protein